MPSDPEYYHLTDEFAAVAQPGEEARTKSVLKENGMMADGARKSAGHHKSYNDLILGSHFSLRVYDVTSKKWYTRWGRRLPPQQIGDFPTIKAHQARQCAQACGLLIKAGQPKESVYRFLAWHRSVRKSGGKVLFKALCPFPRAAAICGIGEFPGIVSVELNTLNTGFNAEEALQMILSQLGGKV